MNALILLAAGRGTRMGNATADKVLTVTAGRPLIEFSLEAAIDSGVIDSFFIVYRNEAQQERLAETVATFSVIAKNLHWVRGGPTRQRSVHNALEKLSENTRHVFIHDAARPLIQPETFRKLNALLEETGSACAARRVTDTIKQSEGIETPRAAQLQTLDRAHLWRMETPQAFERTRILRAYQAAATRDIHLTDDAAALELIGEPVSLLEISYPNPKLTTPDDLAFIEYLLRNDQSSSGETA